jgi:hypothetical protein
MALLCYALLLLSLATILFKSPLLNDLLLSLLGLLLLRLASLPFTLLLCLLISMLLLLLSRSFTLLLLSLSLTLLFPFSFPLLLFCFLLRSLLILRPVLLSISKLRSHQQRYAKDRSDNQLFEFVHCHKKTSF